VRTALCVDLYLLNQSKPASRVHRAPMVSRRYSLNIARKSTTHFTPTVLHALRLRLSVCTRISRGRKTGAQRFAWAHPWRMDILALYIYDNNTHIILRRGFSSEEEKFIFFYLKTELSVVVVIYIHISPLFDFYRILIGNFWK